jgi:predicted PurR-regulated permease PerM
VLLAFLGAFLALIVVFRAVLFPFLMAMFLAYLVEPVVGWVSRGKRLGVHVSRGPAVILMYVVVLGGLFLLGLVAVRRVDGVVRGAATALRTELGRTAAKARFLLTSDGMPRPATEAVDIPAGTLLVRRSDPEEWEESERFSVYRTAYNVRIDVGETDDDVLLEPTREPPPDSYRSLLPMNEPPARLVDPRSVVLPAGLSLEVEARPRARGIEVFSERHVIGPVVARIEKLTGEPFDPDVLRRGIAEESEKASDTVASHLVEWGRGFLGTVVGSIYTAILILMLAAFMIIDRARIAAFFRSLPPPRYVGHYDKLVEYVDRGLAGVIRGQLLICLVNGLLTWAGLALIGVRYAEVLALVAGVFSLIPVFGTIASSVPIVLVALATGGFGAALWALAWIVFIHLLEANLLNPLIMGTHSGMHPVVIVFALLAGEHAFGVWGALLAVPTASILQSCFKYYRHEIEGVPPEPPSGHGRWIRSLLSRRKRAAGTAPSEGVAP